MLVKKSIKCSKASRVTVQLRRLIEASKSEGYENLGTEITQLLVIKIVPLLLDDIA